MAANENLKNAKERQASTVSMSASAGMQPDGHTTRRDPY